MRDKPNKITQVEHAHNHQDGAHGQRALAREVDGLLRIHLIVDSLLDDQRTCGGREELERK